MPPRATDKLSTHRPTAQEFVLSKTRNSYARSTSHQHTLTSVTGSVEDPATYKALRYDSPLKQAEKIMEKSKERNKIYLAVSVSVIAVVGFFPLTEYSVCSKYFFTSAPVTSPMHRNSSFLSNSPPCCNTGHLHLDNSYILCMRLHTCEHGSAQNCYLGAETIALSTTHNISCNSPTRQN